MSKCKACGCSVSFLKLRDGGLCPACHDASIERAKAERRELIPRLLKKHCREKVPSMFAFVHWGVTDRQTALKSVGQAFISAAFSPAPLVGGSDLVGHVGLLAIVDAELIFVDFGLVELGGKPVSLGAGTLKAILETPEGLSVQRATVKDVEASCNKWEQSLILRGMITAEVYLLPVTAEDVCYALPTLHHLTDTINSRAEGKVLTGFRLLGLVLENPQELPPRHELERLSAAPGYVDEFLYAMKQINITGHKMSLAGVAQMPAAYQEAVSSWFLSKSRNAEKAKIAPAVLYSLAVILFVAVAIDARGERDYKWILLSWAIVCATLAGIGWIANSVKNSRRKYRALFLELEERIELRRNKVPPEA